MAAQPMLPGGYAPKAYRTVPTFINVNLHEYNVTLVGHEPAHSHGHPQYVEGAHLVRENELR
jgi:hypothetical protein